MADTTPLRQGSKSKDAFADVETNKLSDHFAMHSQGIYGNHQYTSLRLLKGGKT